VKKFASSSPSLSDNQKISKKGNVLPITGCGGAQGCGMSKLPHLTGNPLTHGSEAVSLMHWPRFTPRKIPTNNYTQNA
jgi:hypothetical protein